MKPARDPLVLIVEDEIDLAETCERLLRRLGFRVRSATSLREGFGALDAERPDLLVSDVHLPDGDGLTLVRAARQRAVPAIVMSGHVSSAGRAAALAAGACTYVAKPFSVATFGALVDQVLA